MNAGLRAIKTEKRDRMAGVICASAQAGGASSR